MAPDQSTHHSVASFLKGGWFKGKKGKTRADGQQAVRSPPIESTSNTPQGSLEPPSNHPAVQSTGSPRALPTGHEETRRAQPTGETTADDSKEDREDQYGLKPLAGPTEEGSNLDPRTPDIVAVHGIDGNAWETWEHKNGTLWLRDLLPRHLPAARIYSFGYQAAVAFTRGRGDVKGFARSLLEGLNAVRYNEVF